jgi:hypothetical protein
MTKTAFDRMLDEKMRDPRWAAGYRIARARLDGPDTERDPDTGRYFATTCTDEGSQVDAIRVIADGATPEEAEGRWYEGLDGLTAYLETP